MIALLLMLPLVENYPAVESVEVNHYYQPVRQEPDDWWVIGWQKVFTQVIIREEHLGRIHISGFAMGEPKLDRVNGWWVVVTTQGTFRTRALFESHTDYDPERAEAEVLPTEHRRGLVK